jgi:putative sterol carrier protein
MRGRKHGMSSKKEIEDALNIVKLKFDDPKLKPRFVGFSKNMQFTFPDLKTTYLIRVNNGVVQSLAEENISTPDIHVTIDSEVLIGIMNKKVNPMTAYQTGQLKAKGNLTDLLKLQKLL